MLQNDLFTYLQANFAGTFPGGIHHMSVPQDVETWPALSFQQVTEVEALEDMEAPNDAKVDTANYQFAVTADASAAAISAADTFNSAFRNFRGTMGAKIVQWVALSNITHLEERQGSQLRRRVILDYAIWYNV